VFEIAVAVPIVLILLLALELLFRWLDHLVKDAERYVDEQRLAEYAEYAEYAARYHRIDTKDLHKDDSI